MSLFDRHTGEEKRKSLEFAERCREEEWCHPSFVGRLFQGVLEWDLIHPYPVPSPDDAQKGDELLKKVEEVLRNGLNPDRVDETRDIPPHVISQLRDLGVFAVKIPVEYGGLGLSQTNYNRLMHLIASYCGSTAALVSAHQSIGVPQPLILFGTEEQKKKFLPRFRQGAISGFALTEPYAGSDPRMIRMTATPVEGGQDYLLNGEKLWCTNGNIADILVVMAQTPPKMIDGKERPQVTAFIVETKTPGVEVAYRCKFMGLNAIQNGVLRFNNVRVPRENILMGEGEGLKLAFNTLNTGRLTLPAAVTGISKWCLWVSRLWAKERRQWGCPIGEHEVIATKLSAMAATVFAMDAVTWLVSAMADDKKFDIRLEAAMAKLFCTEASWKIVDETVQIRGGRGYETAPSLKGRGEPAYAVERAMRDSRINTILEGSSEIMHLFIAREALDFHLNHLKTILDPKTPLAAKAKAAVACGIRYALWYPRLWLPVFGATIALPRSLAVHLKFVRSCAKRLARGIFHHMLLYQQKLVNKENTINRFVDIGTDLFAMSCVLSYAARLLGQETDKKATTELTELFCSAARERIGRKFDELRRNDDKLSRPVARRTLDGGYAWLEKDIVKASSYDFPSG